MEPKPLEYRRITLPNGSEGEDLPTDWNMDIRTVTDWKGVAREPLKIHCTCKKPVYIHKTSPKSDGLHQPNLFAGLEKQLGWERKGVAGEPLKIRGKKAVYIHDTRPKNDGLYLPNLFAGLEKRYGWESAKIFWDDQRKCLKACEQYVNTTEKPAFLLHYAVQDREDGFYCWELEAIQQVFRACPEAIALGDLRSGFLPLHFACQRWHDGLKVISFLLEKYPQAAQNCLNDKEQLPIHVLMGHTHVSFHQDYPIHLVKLLVEAFPESLQKADKQGNLPLHIALKGWCSLECLKDLVEAFPESLQLENQEGDLPLHVAIGSLQPSTIRQYLVEQSPNALRHCNSPLKLAVSMESMNASTSLLSFIRPYPQALLGPDNADTRALLQTRYPQISEDLLEFATQAKEECTLHTQLEWFVDNCRVMSEIFGQRPEQRAGSPGATISIRSIDDKYHKCIQPLQEWADFQLDNLKEKASKASDALEQIRLRVEAWQQANMDEPPPLVPRHIFDDSSDEEDLPLD